MSFLDGTATFLGNATIDGGEVQVLHGARLSLQADLQVDALRINRARPREHAVPLDSVLQASGALQVGELHWGEAALAVRGAVTVSGRALLWARAYHPLDDPGPLRYESGWTRR